MWERMIEEAVPGSEGKISREDFKEMMSELSVK